MTQPPDRVDAPGIDAPPVDAPPDDAPPDDARARRRPRWRRPLVVILFLGVVVGVVGWQVHLPYYTIAPGSTLDMTTRVAIEGARSYDDDGALLLLFVRQNARVNVWEWVQAALDDDIDLFGEAAFTGGESPAEVRAGAQADMARSQLDAERVALEALGYDVAEAQGALVLATRPGRPADGVLAAGDVIVELDGDPIATDAELGTRLASLEPGSTVRLTVDGDDGRRRVDLQVVAEDGRSIIGVYTAQPYRFPIDVEFDTSDIGGPSAGLAMTLAVIDRLTPGELTGGKRVAVTGTIEGDGGVGEIGGVEQKAVAARAADADLMLVPAAEAGDARDRAGRLPVVGVRTLADALDALEAAGGDPLRPATPPPRRA